MTFVRAIFFSLVVVLVVFGFIYPFNFMQAEVDYTRRLTIWPTSFRVGERASMSVGGMIYLGEGDIILKRDGVERYRIPIKAGALGGTASEDFTAQPGDEGSWVGYAVIYTSGGRFQGNIQETTPEVNFTINPAPDLSQPSITLSVYPAKITADQQVSINSTSNSLAPYTPLSLILSSGTLLTTAIVTTDGYGNYAGAHSFDGAGQWQIWAEYQGQKISNVLSVEVTPAASKKTVVPTVTFTADPETIAAGELSTLFWSSIDANRCDATTDNWTTDYATDGSNVISPTVTTIYGLKCIGIGGSTSESVTVTVNEGVEVIQKYACNTDSQCVANPDGSYASSNCDNECQAGDGSEDEDEDGGPGPIGGLVPCGRSQDDRSTPEDETRKCGTCDILILGSRVINFILFTVTPAIAVLLFLIAGFMILLGGANPGLVGSGKNIFKTTVYGLLLVFGAWMVTNTILKSIAGNSPFTEDWNKVVCAEPSAVAPPPPPPPVACDGSELAIQYTEPYPRQNHPELLNLMACIRSKMGAANLGEISTYDKTYELCNYTRGNKIAGCTPSCSHAVNSCHYGGATGINGAQAVDYGNEDVGDQIRAAAIDCGAKSTRCETSSGQTVACNSSSATHVHVNSASCDRN